MLLRNDVICLQSTQRYNAEDRHRHRQMKYGHIRGQKTIRVKITSKLLGRNREHEVSYMGIGVYLFHLGLRRIWQSQKGRRPLLNYQGNNLFRQLNECIIHVKWVHYHHGMARPRVADRGDGLHIRRAAANMLNKQSRTADSWWSSILGVGRGG
jgi:hypothetical protein